MGFAVRDTHIAEPSRMRVPARGAERQGVRQEARRAARPHEARAAADRADARQRHRLSHRGRSRPPRGLAHQLALLERSAPRSAPRRPASCSTTAARASCSIPAHPNTLGPSKRPMHTIIPALAMRDGRCDTTLRRDGRALPADGPRPDGAQPVRLRHGHAERDRCAARVLRGRATVVERGMPAATVEGLRARGHQVVPAPTPWGGAQAIRIDWQRGVLIGGSEPRKDGCALGY